MAEPYFKGGPKPQTLSETAEDFYGIGSYLSLMAPSAGISDVLGFAPDPSKVGDTMPSFSENIESGNYLDAGLQTLGASGDVMLAASPFFPALAVPAAVAKGLSTVGKSMKSTKSLPSKSDAPQDVFHYTPDAELGFTIFDPNKAPNALDALGTHVGTKKAASDRFMALEGKAIANNSQFVTGNVGKDEAGNFIRRTTRGGTYPLKANLSNPYTPDKFYEGQVSGVGPSKEVWGESDIYAHLLDKYNENRGTKYSMRALVGDEPDFPFSDFRKFIGEFRLKLAEDGFTHLPYYNEVEDYGSISYVMLTDRPEGSASVLKGKFGANDPKERTNPDIMKEAGGVISLKDKAVNMTRGPQGIEPFIKFMV
jgi:hypothetical protein